MHLHKIYCMNPACPAFIAEEPTLDPGAGTGLDRSIIAGRIRTSQHLAVRDAVKGLSRHLLRDIGIDLSAAG